MIITKKTFKKFLTYLFLIFLTFIFILFILSMSSKTKKEDKMVSNNLQKLTSKRLYLSHDKLYNTYIPQNYKIINYKIKNLSIEMEIYTKKTIYKAYIYPKVILKDNIQTEKEISEYLKSIDRFIFLLKKYKGQSFREIYIFDTKKIYVQ
ncbi:MAG: hypothetical protein RMJ36_04620 [Candidatus Calescibacterium sp.]|nr:hypothetical protein [Candidatus Calescibacterium sp.]MDW8132917.1 hypothetical protein [Candidatus Calescibacterium sp.]